MPDLTVITTTYNRADCLHNCYSSLKKQTCMDFQWLVVDDGSTDDTRNVIKQFQDTPHVFEIDTQRSTQHIPIFAENMY